MADLKKVRIQLLDSSGVVVSDVDPMTSGKAVTVLKDGTEITLQAYLEGLVLQKGDKGDKGDKGEKGDKGDSGLDGTSGDSVRVGADYASASEVKLFLKEV